MSPARTQTQAAQSRGKRTSHEATMSPKPLATVYVTISQPVYHNILFCLLIKKFMSCLLQSIHESFLRTVPSYTDQANVWLGLLNYFEWSKVILLTSNDQDSRMIATRFTGLAERNGIEVIVWYVWQNEIHPNM